ncbi:NHS-like protein 1 isoform X2 [Heterodontus francisci]|uniref:NHS-like protein 1 isoform X2 n=1 Tax=Heterodontus francisci TaxID=7792 RepID=UPI00355C5277
MPFYKRIVEPRLVSRLRSEDFGRVWEDGEDEGVEEDGHGLQRKKRRRRKKLEQELPQPSAFLFESLQDVSGYILASLLRQLADLSRLASGIFQELEVEANSLCVRCSHLHNRLHSVQHRTLHLDAKKVAVPVSNLDEESKWTVHYKASWHQQENVFLPSSRSACVEDLHQQAKVNLKTVLRDCDKLRKDGFRSSQYYSQGPIFTSSSSHLSGSCLDEEEDQEQMSTVKSVDEEKLYYSRRSKTPVASDLSEIDVQTNWTKALPLPTPEEKMRQQAQAVQSDVIPINVTGAGQTPVRGHSVVLPGQYSTMSRLESSKIARGRSATRDSSCQTEEVKVVPPSVRRIRAQKGQGIAAQLSSSSGNVTAASDRINTPRPSGELRFHSLPRPRARVSLHVLDNARCTLGKPEESFGTLPARVGKLRMDGSVSHLRTDALSRPKSQEMPGRQANTKEPTGLVHAVPPRIVPSTRIVAQATLSSKAEVVAIRTSQGRVSCSPPRSAVPTPLTAVALGSAGGLREEHCSSSGNWSGSSGGNGGSSDRHSPTSDTVLPPSLCDSAVSLALGPQVEVADPRRAKEGGGATSSACTGWPESSNGGSMERLVCGTPVSALPSSPEMQVMTLGPLTPICHVYNSSDHPLSPPPLSKADWSPLYMEAQFSPTEVTVGSRNEGKGRRGLESQSNYSDRSLGRSISLKKTKKPPLPPARTDSLRKKAKSARPVLSESLIATLQRSLEVNLKGRDGPPASPSEGRDPWAMRPRSQSSASVGGGSSNSSGRSTAASNAYSTGAATPSQSETSSLRSEYSDPWAYYTEGGSGRIQDGAPQPSAWDHTQDELPRAYTSLGINTPAKSKSSSPDKSHGVTSPSSGYSSQCNTPTMLNPAPMFSPGPGMPKTKPKVPERKSSLLSSVSASSSSASLSSNASDSRHQATGVRAASSSTPAASSIDPDLNPPLPPPPLPLDTYPLPAPPLDTYPLPAPPLDTYPLPAPPLDTYPLPAPPLDALPLPAPPLDTLPLPAPPLDTLPLPAPPLDTLPLPAPPLPPPAPPLDPKMLNCVKQPPHSSIHPCRKEPKALADQDEAYKPTMGLPLITPKALQMVRLRSVRRSERADPPRQAEEPSSRLKPRPELPVSPPPRKSAVLQRPSSLCRPAKHHHQANAVPGSNLALGSESRAVRTDWSETLALSTMPEAGAGNELVPMVEPPSPVPTAQSKGTGARIDIGQDPERRLPPENANAKSPSKMPPPIARKPKLNLLVPPSPWNLAPQEKWALAISESAAKDTTTMAVSAGTNGDQPSAQNTEMTESDSSCPAGRSEDTLRHMAWEADQRDAENVLDESWKNLSVQEEQATDTWDNMEESSTITCVDDEMGDVFDPTSPIFTNSCGWTGEDPSTPIKPRTTEDLFAAIHRSKRRVLGRKDSEDELSKILSPSPPVTPTGNVSSPGTLKQVGSIQRNLRKSSTSSDSFKALLLKKGSRTEAGCRMSAAEMLRSTDPRHRQAESSPEAAARTNSWSPADCRSPGHRGRNPREEWASHEGPLPRGTGLVGIRHGRSRTPPSAASSRYGARHLHRLHSSPMTVICEGEAETSEATEGQLPNNEGRRHSESDILSSNSLGETRGKQESVGSSGSGHVDSAPTTRNLPDSMCGATDVYPAQNGSGTSAEEAASQDWHS